MRSLSTRRASAVVAAAAVLLLAGCAARGSGDGPAAAGTSPQAQQQAFFAAMAARDAAAAAAFFADDAVLHVAGRPPVRGRVAIAQFYAGMFPYLSEAAATPETLVPAAAGDMAYGTGATTNRFSGPQGDMSYHGKYLLVWRRVDGAWRIAAYSISSDEG